MVKGVMDWEYTKDDGFTLHFKPPFVSIFGGETYQHAKAARKEMLLTLRSIIDSAIKHTDDKESSSDQHSVKIEVE